MYDDSGVRSTNLLKTSSTTNQEQFWTTTTFKMHIRPMLAEDIPACATVFSAAFEADELWNWLAPDHQQHPLSWREQSIRQQRVNFYHPHAWSIVCVADTDDAFAPAGEIVGCLRWLRHTAREDAAAAADLWERPMTAWERLEGWLAWAEMQWDTTSRVNRSVLWDRSDTFRKSIAKSTTFDPLAKTTHWHLSNLAVVPQYQRRGIATALVQWGLDHAASETADRKREGKVPVPVTLVASIAGLPLYARLGFKVVGWEDDSFLDFSTDGGASMVWDSSGYWLKDVAHEPPMKRGVVDAVFPTSAKKELSDLQT
ncbi:hypothetical protein FH972_022631 [Carpinus fangiana]|uniref:N-acetyltransferase domain-containing protein n=1 Tax=Carpinus fangiana TaxID=176857 RepID=A0A5N6KST7_9ROSI|nr:hypothetical protein FH972_022631 [Carpinus fangiana]